jgi:hypothetical protein
MEILKTRFEVKKKNHCYSFHGLAGNFWIIFRYPHPKKKQEGGGGTKWMSLLVVLDSSLTATWEQNVDV